MPRIENIELKFENPQDINDLDFEIDQLRAVVNFEALFNEDEKRLNLNYSFYGYLLERDGALDKYIIWPNGNGIRILKAPIGNRDDFIAWLNPVPLRLKPDNRNKVDLEMKKRFDFENRPRLTDRVISAGNESYDQILQEYKAIIIAIPDVCWSANFSNDYQGSLSNIARAFDQDDSY